MMKVKRAKVFWDYNNCDGTFGYTYGSTKRNLDVGYYTFEDIAKTMEGDGITLTKITHSRRCSLNKQTAMDDELKSMLGYTATNPNGLSQGQVDVNRGLRMVNVRCGSLDRGKNFNDKGQMDRILLSIPVTTEQSLNGSVVDMYVDCVAELDNGVHSYLDFEVTDQDDNPIEVGTIVLDVYVP